jgi:hypothetical protein
LSFKIIQPGDKHKDVIIPRWYHHFHIIIPFKGLTGGNVLAKGVIKQPYRREEYNNNLWYP